MDDPQRYRSERIKEFSTRLNILTDKYHTEIINLRRKITASDVIPYCIIAVTGAVGVFLTGSPLPPAFIISLTTAITSITSKVSDKFLSCYHRRLKNVIFRYKTASEAATTMTALISKSADNTNVSDGEFREIDELYGNTILKLKQDNVDAQT